MIPNSQKEILKKLILGILNKTGEIPKVKLAKLVLFAEIEYFTKHNKSFTGLYFVRLKKGPVIAFFDEVLNEGEGIYWEKNISPINIYEEGKEKVQYSYKAKENISLEKPIEDILNHIVKKYGKMTGTELSKLAHSLPAWKYSEPNEPIYVAELATKDEAEYFALSDLVEDMEDRNESLPKEISQALQSS